MPLSFIRSATFLVLGLAGGVASLRKLALAIFRIL